MCGGLFGNRLLSFEFKSKRVYLKCINCNSTFNANPMLFLCPKCGGLLEVIVEVDKGISWDRFRARRFNVWRYRELLPVPSDVEIVTLGEGGTPLIPLVNMEHYGLPRSLRVYVKFEGSNPTGSFKDRGMTVAVSLAKYVGVKAAIVASTGNTAASASAYSARAKIKCIVLLPKGKVAKGKLGQAILHGAQIIEVKGSFDNALEAVMKTVKTTNKLYPLNSFNPWRLEGQKTIAYEIADELNNQLDWVIVPVGNAGNISAIWKGFRELYKLKLIEKLPKMIGVQAEGASPLVKTWSIKSNKLIPVNKPETCATAIRIGKPINWAKALKAVKESKGMFIAVSDSEIIESQKILAKFEGIDVEPAGAVGLAALLKLNRENIVDHGSNIVIVATGHALKDVDIIIKYYDVVKISADTTEVLSVIDRIISK